MTGNVHGSLEAVLAAAAPSHAQLAARLEGLGDPEYLWQPVPGSWNVRPSGERYVADFVKPDPDPAPVTTIAWRLWHISVDCMDSYSIRAFQSSVTGLTGTHFVGSATEAVGLLDASTTHFYDSIASLGEDGVQSRLGEGWGPYADSTFFELALHTHRELTHHGAEIGVLRDLYAAGRGDELR